MGQGVYRKAPDVWQLPFGNLATLLKDKGSENKLLVQLTLNSLCDSAVFTLGRV